MIEDLYEGILNTVEFLFNRLPADKQQIETLARLARYLNEQPSYAFKLDLAGHNDPGEIWLAWQRDGYRMILTYPMEDFGWPYPLVLSGESLTYSEICEVLKGICLEGRETNSFPVISERFRDVTSEAFGDFSTGAAKYDGEE